MDREERQDKLIEYLYGEIPPEEKPAFQQQLESDPELNGDLKSYLQLRQLFHEHLPEQKVPRALTQKLLRDLGIRHPWHTALLEGFWRPALAGAFVLALTLGITYTWKQLDQQPPTLAEHTGASSLTAIRSVPGPDDEAIGDRLLAKTTVTLRLKVPARRHLPSTTFLGRSPRVSLAGYGRPLAAAPSPGFPVGELHRLEMESNQALAKFHHGQALRLRALGEFKAAAEHLGHLIKKYPFYPLKFFAMAQRVDCLFQAGESTLAQAELRVLGSVSPNLAYVIERRWTGEFQE